MPIVPPLNTEAYLNYEELTAYLNSIAEAVPHLVRIFSLGNSLGGRALWAAEVTNTNTGPARSKPAVWLDGNINGGQYSTTASCLAVLQRLAAEHGRSPFITDLLDTKTFYIVPRLSPDGAELALSSGLVTSVGRRLSFFDGLREGLVPGDINGDGRILQMRVKSPNGQWKVSRRDERLMVRREPGETEGDFYSLYREGFLDGEAGEPLRLRLIDYKRDLCHDFTPSCGDINRHYGGSGGAGPFSQAESRLVSAFLRSLDNLCLAVSFRSGEGKIKISGDEAIITKKDCRLFELLAEKASEILHVPAESVRESTDFADWLYTELGVPCLRIDSWNVLEAAGCESTELSEAGEAELAAVLRWLDRSCEGRGFAPWSECEHPRLGVVEVGGWDPAEGWFNPPAGDILAEICEAHIDAALNLAASLPRINLGACSDTVVGWAEPDDDEGEMVPLRIISVEIINEGYLPAWVSDRGRSKDEPLITEISLNENCALLMGRAVSENESPAGIVSPLLRPGSLSPFFSGCSDRSRCMERWLVKGAGEIVVSACHPRCGVVQYVTDGGSELRQQFKVSKPSAVIPSYSEAEAYVSGGGAPAPAAPPLPVNAAHEASAASGKSMPAPPAAPSRAQFKMEQKKAQRAALRNSGDQYPVREPEAEPGEEQPQVRAVNLTEITASKSALQKGPAVVKPQPQPDEAEPPAEPEEEEEIVYTVPSRAGFRPTVSGGPRPVQTTVKNSGLRSDFARPTVSAGQSGLRKSGSLEPVSTSSLIKGDGGESARRGSVQPSGRVFGQPPSRQGGSKSSRSESMNRALSSQRAQLSEDGGARQFEAHEVRPHPLLPGKAPRRPVGEPQDSLPEAPGPGEEGLESPPVPSAPKLLRRTRGEE